MKETSPDGLKVVDSDVIGQKISLIDEYFGKQSPLAQLVEIKGAFLKTLNLIDDINAQMIKLNRRTSNTNARLTVLEGRLRQVVEDLAYHDISIEMQKEI